MDCSRVWGLQLRMMYYQCQWTQILETEEERQHQEEKTVEQESRPKETDEAAIQRLTAELIESKKGDDFLRSLEDLTFDYETVANEQADCCRQSSMVPLRGWLDPRKPEWEPEVTRHFQPARPRPVWEPPCLDYSEFDEDGEV